MSKKMFPVSNVLNSLRKFGPKLYRRSITKDLEIVSVSEHIVKSTILELLYLYEK